MPSECALLRRLVEQRVIEQEAAAGGVEVTSSCGVAPGIELTCRLTWRKAGAGREAIDSHDDPFAPLLALGLLFEGNVGGRASYLIPLELRALLAEDLKLTSASRSRRRR